MFYIPSAAWWLVAGAAAAFAAAFWGLVLLPGEWGRQWTGPGRVTFPMLSIGLALGLYFLEHLYRLRLDRDSPGPTSHPLALSHLASELIPLVLILGLLGLIVGSWLGWARLLALVAGADSFLLLFWPGPLVNHLFQLLTLVAVVWGTWGLVITLSKRAGGWAGPSLLVAGGGTGVYCELGMMFL
jgi:hypothetical protein